MKKLPKVAVAAVIFNSSGEILSVTRRGTSTVCLPGGKVDPGETNEQALVRELKEETGLTFDESDFTPIYSSIVLGQDGHDFYCVSYAYLGPYTEPIPHARWFIEEGIEVKFITVPVLFEGTFVDYNRDALDNYYRLLGC